MPSRNLLVLSLVLTIVHVITKSSEDLWPGEQALQLESLPDAGTEEAKAQASGLKLMSCSKKRRQQVSAALPKLSGVMVGACKHVLSARPRVEAMRRWEQASHPLRKAEQLLKSLLVSHLLPLQLKAADELSPWLTLSNWVDDLALESDVLEVRALRARAWEALFWQSFHSKQLHPGQGAGVLILPSLIDSTYKIVDEWSRAGRVADAQRAHDALMQVEWPSASCKPLSYFFDAKDYRLVTQGPEPDLRVLPVPIPLEGIADFQPILPIEVINGLQTQWLSFADEARAAARFLGRGDGEPGDAYPGISAGNQWTKLEIYDVGRGWRGNLCETILPKLCKLLKGKLPSESAKAQKWVSQGLIAANDETVGLFSVRAGGWAGLHNGQAIRVNIHLCLVNCNKSRIVVGGKDLAYSDGSLFAFEDRVQHEVLNEATDGSSDRINLVIGVLHPDYDPDKGEGRRSQWKRLDWWLEQLRQGKDLGMQAVQEAYREAVRVQDTAALDEISERTKDVDLLPDGLHAAAMSGHSQITKHLLKNRADPSLNVPTQPLDVAAAMGHLGVAKLLVNDLIRRGVKSLSPPDREMPPAYQIAQNSRHTDLANFLLKKEKELTREL